ncbi:hypothetical protein KADA111694_03570 [Kaistella daneshvariae]
MKEQPYSRMQKCQIGSDVFKGVEDLVLNFFLTQKADLFDLLFFLL